MNFGALQKRLVLKVREHIRNGEFTERGFARAVGISQVHIHNVLKGRRTLSINLNDLILKRLGLTIFDICTPAELYTHLAHSSVLTRPSFHLPFLKAQIGPGIPWSGEVDPQDRHPVPCFLAGAGSNLVLARLAQDGEMDDSLANSDIVLFDLAPSQPSPDALYLVDRGQDTIIRRVRPGAHKLYLAADANLDRPESWEALTPPFSPGVVRGRVRWLGKEQIGPDAS
ncbi:MAG: helix-turn-helix domain-containing protein [Acidobacteriota bacterium]|nr:helix-turn-helix domain-containing protein [Acidobacteriota bacterium]